MLWIVFHLSLESVLHNRTVYWQRTACASLAGRGGERFARPGAVSLVQGSSQER